MTIPGETSLVMTDAVAMVRLRGDQAETFDALEFEVNRIERHPGRVSLERLARVDQLGVALWRLCRQLERALDAEDKRLTVLGTTDDLDDRWIKNLRRLETMRQLLNRAERISVKGMQQ
jgi:hypothetical protein